MEPLSALTLVLAVPEDLGRSFGMFSQLLRVLREADVPDRYDALIVDPPATEGPRLYNAILATARSSSQSNRARRGRRRSRA